ncbi:hypothetical protein [Nocardioides dongkuii]|uniref:hypothetical protein n=1 Tax=Nocardioides dongkuii TaxID=2760089 RepID=UPI001878BE12|nr:hypothetical protein [Nocardioides dongkuii]
MSARDRTRVRNRLYLIGLLPAVLMLAVSGRVGVLLVQQSSGLSGFEDKQYAEARDDFRANQAVAPFERWVAPFNEGAAEHREKDWPGAIASYEDALAHAPQEWECVVRNNLALAHEAVGDAALKRAGRSDAEAAWSLGRTALVDCREEDPQLEDRAGRDVRQQERDRKVAAKIDRRLADKLDEDVNRAAEPKKPKKRDKDQAKRERDLAKRNQQALAKRLLEMRARENEQDRQFRERRAADFGLPAPPPTW